MSMVEKKLEELGLTLPQMPKPLAAYVPGIKVGDFIYTSGQIPLLNGQLKYQGQIGGRISLEEGYQAAQLCALNCLSVVKNLIGDLNQVEQIVKVVGFVNSAPGFTQQPQVINGASELLGTLFEQKGRHARSAVGVNSLPLGAACEVEIIVQVKKQEAAG